MMEGNCSSPRNNGGLPPSLLWVRGPAAGVVAAMAAVAMAIDTAAMAIVMMRDLNHGRSGKTLADLM
jgi:hypothetical protein